jgi:septum site-determining protein MinC
MSNLVVFKGMRDGVAVIFDQEAAFATILENFKEKLEGNKKFFEGAKANLSFKGRLLSSEEQEILIELLKEQNILNISFLHDFEEKRERRTEKLDWLTKEIEKEEVSLSYVHKGIIRSGQKIHYEGSVVILGDVNPGGVVTAGGYIIVLGDLKGKVHAGLSKDEKYSFVAALSMDPLQIGIQNIIAQCQGGDYASKKKEYVPKMAYIYKDEIYIDEIDFKSLHRMIE